jgi:heavy metal sensor kinase
MLKSRTSISLRLTLWFGAIFLAGWVLFGMAMWMNLKHTLADERQVTLSHRVDRLRAVLDKSEDAASRYEDFKDFAHATGGGLVEIFRADGSRVLPSPSRAAQSFPWPVFNAGAEESFYQVNAPDQPYWVLARRSSLDGETVYLVAAAPEGGNLLVLSRFWEGLIVSAPILLLISSAGGYWLSRKALKPVDRIAAAARSISISNLSERLPVARTGDELERLAETCNAMLARLEVAVNQIKQFTADASHELRGPLTFVRTVAEVAQRNPKADPESLRAFEDIVEETANATVLLEDMLTLARADAEGGNKALQSLNLAAIVEEACEMARPIAEDRHLNLSVSLAASHQVKVLGDVTTLRRLIWILLDNALKYTQSPGRIDVSMSANSHQATVEVRDSGMGISAADLPHIFNRFYRADPSRSNVEGAGLGLAIAKWIAEMHHAELSVTSELDRGTAFQLAFPSCLSGFGCDFIGLDTQCRSAD